MDRPLLILAMLAACAGAAEPVPAASTAGGPEPHGDAPYPTPVSRASSGVLARSCEASTIVPWEGGWLVGDNEDPKELWSYGPDFSLRGPVPLPVAVDDVEALALVDGGYWVVGSRSTNKSGEPRPLRERLLGPDGQLHPVSFEACPRCTAQRGVRPDLGGLNIEGAAWFEGRLWLGLRGPLAESGAALLLGLDEAGAVAEVVEVDLSGNGIRELVPHDGALLIVAGPVADANVSHALYRLSAIGAAPERLHVTLQPSTEGIAIDPADPTTLIYVTDGSGKPGKCTTPATWGRLPFRD